MSGTIGLTNAGQYLDKILTENNPPYKSRLTTFIQNFSRTLKRIRLIISECDIMNDKCLILNLLRNEYMMRFDKHFKEVVDELTYSLTRNYIYTLTLHNFIPTTRTQIDLIRKQKSLNAHLKSALV